MTKSEGLFETNWKRLAFVAALILCAFLLDRYFDREVAGIRCPSEFSSDPTPRLVQLFDDVRDDPGGLFQLQLPKSWSFCEYNHSYTRQIQVELMLDKHTLAPLTEVALRERRLGWVGDRGRLMNQYRDRQLIVFISALISPSSSEVARLHRKASQRSANSVVQITSNGTTRGSAMKPRLLVHTSSNARPTELASRSLIFSHTVLRTSCFAA